MDGQGSVPGTTRDRVKLKVLLERLPLTRAKVKSLLLVMDRQEVEGRDAEDGEGEWNGGQTDLASVHTASERNSDDECAKHVV